MHRPGPNYQPAEITTLGLIGGHYDVQIIPPGAEFEIEESKGLRLLACFEHVPTTGPAIR
jgi:hypothetical protein